MTATPSAKVEWITIAGELVVWRSIGLHVTDDGLVPLFGTSLRIVSPTGAGSETIRDDRETIRDEAGRGVVGWALSSAPRRPATIDGLRSEFVVEADPIHVEHPLGAAALDHLVVLTPDLERTSVAIAEATGSELRRIREVPTAAGTMRQGFHRIGERGQGGLIVELVERPALPEGPATFWGIVLIVDDLDSACRLLGSNRVGQPKDAVQPGRRIATVREDIGLGLPLALMSP